MYIFLPDGFYSLRPYDPERGDVPAGENYVEVRARTRQDLDKVRAHAEQWPEDKHYPNYIELGSGKDYKYHAAVPALIVGTFLLHHLDKLGDMKGGYDGRGLDVRMNVHANVWAATLELEDIDEGEVSGKT